MATMDHGWHELPCRLAYTTGPLTIKEIENKNTHFNLRENSETPLSH